MDFMQKENASIISDRGGLKENFATPCPSKRQQNALCDLRNTVHKKHPIEPSSSKSLFEIDTRRELKTPSPCQKLTPAVKCIEPELDVHAEDLDDDQSMLSCPCNSNDLMFEDDYLPERPQLTDADIENLASIWFGQGGRDVEEDFDFSPVKFERKNIDIDAIIMKPDMNETSLNDSGIDLDIDLELDEMLQDI